MKNGVKNIQAVAYNGVRAVIIAVNTKYALKRFFFQYFMLYKALLAIAKKSLSYLAFYHQV